MEANSTGWIKQNGIVENGKAYKITVDADCFRR